MNNESKPVWAGQEQPSCWQLFVLFFSLGCTSFGGPVAHLEIFRRVFVEQRRWFTPTQYADLVALCQFLPGPASSQVGMAIGMLAAGYRGALCAWLGFTLPSAALLAAFAWGMWSGYSDLPAGLGQGLALATVAIVAQALVGMSRTLTPDWPRKILAVLCAGLMLWGSHWGWQILLLLIGAGVGVWWSRQSSAVVATPQQAPADGSLWCGANPHLPSRKSAALWLGLFTTLLLILPLLATQFSGWGWQLLDSLYRAGALVFGGGHVVLPLLQAEAVPNGWLSDAEFLAGYGAAQLVPGPLFSVAALIGSFASADAGGWLGAILATVAIFLPAMLLIFAALPFWLQGIPNPQLQAACRGIHVVVLGLLMAAFVQPVLSHGIRSWLDLLLALLAFIALQYGRWPIWLVVPLTTGAALLF